MDDPITINRTIYFYQLLWIDTNGKRVIKDPSFLISIVGDSYLTEVDKVHDLLLEKKEVTSTLTNISTSYWTLSKNRKIGIPAKYNKKEKTHTHLPFTDDDSLEEASHFVIYGGKFIGAEFNNYGKSVGTGLSDILNKILNENPKENIIGVEVNKILRPDVFSRIDRLFDIRGFKIKIATNYMKMLSSENNDFNEMAKSCELVENMYLTLYYSIGHQRDSTSSRFTKLFHLAKQLVIRPDYLDGIKELAVRGREKSTDEPHFIDLMEEQLLSKVKVIAVDTKTRAVNTENMFKMIDDVYTVYNKQLQEYVTTLNDD